jgi:hypothetical protein
MTSQHDKPKRWRPRFSVRTLVIVVTPVCSYAACWGPTKTQGIEDIRARQELEPVAIVPFVITSGAKLKQPYPGLYEVNASKRSYYFWFFGYVAKLPYERDFAARN